MAYISNRASPLLQLALGPGGVAGNTPDQIQPVRVASMSGEVSKVSDTFGDYPAVIVRQVWPLGVAHQYDALLAKDVKHKRRKERVGKSAEGKGLGHRDCGRIRNRWGQLGVSPSCFYLLDPAYRPCVSHDPPLPEGDRDSTAPDLWL